MTYQPCPCEALRTVIEDGAKEEKRREKIMNESHLKQGQRLAAIWGPLNPEGQVGFSATTDAGVEAITVSQLAGPMGWYDVAVVTFYGGRRDAIFPLHMMEQIDPLAEQSQ